MNKYVFLFLTAFLMQSCVQKPNQTQSNSMDHSSMTREEMMAHGDKGGVRDGVFIHITESYNDPHKVLMPLKMALMMSMDKDVLVYCDIKSVELFVKGAKDLEYKGYDSFQTYVKQLVEHKVDVFVCPTCLKVAGYKEEDLMDGVKIAQKDRFFNFTKGRIITLDY